jgi:hypothetical protein
MPDSVDIPAGVRALWVCVCEREREGEGGGGFVITCLPAPVKTTTFFEFATMSRNS